MTDYSSSHVLNDFIHAHKLMDKYSRIDFNAVVTITTSKGEVTNLQVRVMVELDGYDNIGRLTLIENELDPLIYPTSFDAKWQTFEHMNNEFLLISGNHKQNADIGQYKIKIIPLERARK